MPNFVISLASALQRREHIQTEFRREGIEFIDAVTPHKAVPISQQLGFDLSAVKHLTETEKACLLSHACLWQYALSAGIPVITIFEDDVCLGKNACLYLKGQIDRQLPSTQSPIDILKLETFDELTHIKSHAHWHWGIDSFTD